MKKTLELILISRLNYIVKKYNLLFNIYFEKKRVKSLNNAMHVLIKKFYVI